MVLFSEDHIQETRRRGRIEVICGSMFSGKTEELIRRLKRAKFARQRVEIFKPAIDVRYSEADVVSHDSNTISSTPIDSSASILLFTSEIDVVGIDEAQFFDSSLIEVCNQLANNGIRVIIAGLDMDFKGNPFGPMPGLCAIADEVSKVHAICVKCGQLASFSHRTVKNDKQVLLGETAEYEPLCRECYLRALEEDKEKGYNLSDCRAELGIDNNDIKEYLKDLSIENYVETCDDERNKNSNSYYVFGKFVNEKEIYIKVKIQSYDKKIVVCMSFHFAEYKLNYPYK